MRFRAQIRNINTFAKLTGSLLLLSKVVWIRLDNEQVRFTVIPERGSQDSIFEDYVIQSATAGNTINLQVSLTHLNRALRSALTATSASLRLTKKDSIPLLSLTILTTTFASFRPPATLENADDPRNHSEAPNPIQTTEVDQGNEDSVPIPNQSTAPFPHDRETTITQSVPVTVLAPQSVASIHEPTCREPDVHILLPPLFQLKAISERFTKLALPNSTTTSTDNSNTRLILSASPFGEFRIGVQTTACKIESKWQGLTNPELDPSQIEGGEEGVREHASTRLKDKARAEAWASVRVDARDWGRVLGVGRLGGRVVACFCNDYALILYVYLENEESGADDSVLTPEAQMTMGDQRLDYLFYHVFLPTQVPQRSDTQNGQGDRALLEVLLESIDAFRTANDHAYYQQWSTVQRALRTFSHLHSKSKTLSRDSLRTALRDAAHGEVIVLHIALQNSGLIIQKKNIGYVIETFEVSPRAADVLAAQGALEWDFPSQAVVVPPQTFEDDSFQDTLAGFLEKASLEPVKQYAATTLKAGSNAYESRDTTLPAIIGQLLITILEVPGRKHSPTLTRKRIRDEVCWNDAEDPWRRSAMWLVLRVSIQRILCSLLGPHGTLHYKFFICTLMSSLCHEFCTQSAFPPDRLAFARAKLARRVAKLESQGKASSSDVSVVIHSLFIRNERGLTGTLRTLTKTLEDRGNQLRNRHTKKMYRLPKRADPESMVLSLHHSWHAVNDILTEVYYGRQRAQVQLPQSYQRVARTWIDTQPNDQVTPADYYRLADMETRLAASVEEALEGDRGIELDHTVTTVLRLRRHLQMYQALACRAYKENVEQLSLMILTLMEAWMGLDSLAVIMHPLLLDYDPGFPLDLMHPLKTAKLSDMHRLRNIEEYLERRRKQAIYPLSSVLGDPTKNCFAVRYFDQCEDMQILYSTIWKANESAKGEKEQELIDRSKEYEKLVKQAFETACLFIEDEHDPMKRQHDGRHCRKCYLERAASRMRIDIYEDLLPTDDILAKAIIFELLLPSGFAAWRDCTWQLLTLARGDTIPDQKPKLLLREYSRLDVYARTTDSAITLASRTKSFYQTHYSRIAFPAQLEQVCLPHGLKYGIYDAEHALWISRHLDRTSFASLCSPDLPPRSAWSSLQRYLHPTFNDAYPSANEIVAGQTRCPNNLTIAEYSSFQDLRLGTRIQWIKLIRELVSSNINFGSVEVTSLVTELALGTGPPEDGNVLRATHWLFRNQAFCQNLAACIRKRLQAIATNWREGQTVECLLVLVQRLWSLGQSVEAVNEGRELMLFIRNITHDWIRSLRREICNTVEVETAQKRSRESLHAALLCRKTFMLEAATADPGFQHAAFACFLECAFTIKDNLSLSESGYTMKMQAALRRLYVSDLKLVHSLESQIRWSVQNVQSAVGDAVNKVWMDADGPSARTFSSWTILPAPDDYWCTAQSLGDNGILEQSIHFNIIDGALLINGQLLGRLPEEFSQQAFFQQFFGNRNFLTRPSYLQGMSYMFVTPIEQHYIHFGYRDGYQFMRVQPRSSTTTVLELLPSAIFLNGLGTGASDLPLPLVHDCVHWLDLQAQMIEVRPFATKWRAKSSDWRIDLRSRQGMRRNKSMLVDPRSNTFRRIAQLIEPFENRNGMVVYQPIDPRSNITVNLPGLELTFRVSFDGLLGSRQLRAFVDMDQDAGTLYGLKSSLVLRDSVLKDNRSVLVAMGPATIERHEGHVNVSIVHTGYYARFSINTLLGRLECAVEPRLLYFKDYCHAVTSSIHPDPLTSRTGTEEALSCLQAANAQPWAPLDSESYRILFLIADLTPPRVYYPEDSRALQRVVWDEKVMPAAQSDNFRPLIEDILQQCAALHRFHLDSDAVPIYKRQGNLQLHKRALLRAQDFQPAQQYLSPFLPLDVHYDPRDSSRMAGCKDAYEAAMLTWTWSLDIRVDPDLAARLQEWPSIQGYVHNFEVHLLSSLINFEPAANWGSLFRYCQQAQGEKDKSKLMFLFGIIAFGGQMNMSLIRSLIAIAIMDDNKDLQLPKCTEFILFRRNQIPTVEHLAQYIRPQRIPYPKDERALLAVAMHSKQRRKLELAQKKYEEASEVDCKTLASHLLSQWPLREATIKGLPELPLLNVQEALNWVRPEWERLADNYQLSEHLAAVQNLLNLCRVPVHPKKKNEDGHSQEWYPSWKAASVRLYISDLLYRPLKEVSVTDGNIGHRDPSVRERWVTRLNGIISQDLPTLLGNASGRLRQPADSMMRWPSPVLELEKIISHFSRSEDPVRSAYGQDLNGSLFALQQGCKNKSGGSSLETLRVDTRVLDEAISSAQDETESKLESIRESMVKEHKWLEAGGLLPISTPIALLETLRNGTRAKSRGTIQADMLSYAESIVSLQQLLRIRNAHRQADKIQLDNERRNIAHTGWKTEDHIDWLLLEIDFDLIIREDQLQVAQAMLASPSTISNFVLQMKMGQGKSSVIIPMVATALAKDENLGLINRKIKHVPFSRKSPTDLESIKAYHKLHSDIHKSRGVLLALPEHLLSFQLSGLQALSNGHVPESTYMIKLQAWFARKARDVLDECDHMLAVKTQLIYPSGAQSPVDGHPNRWKLVQTLLKLAKTHFHQLRREYPRSLEVIDRISGAFPTVYFLDQHVKDVFVRRLTDSVLRGDGGLLPVQECSREELAFVADFLHHAQFAKSSASNVAQVLKKKKDARLQLLLLRGLLIHKILLMGLSKRWNVQYGIHPLRDPIAVPFRSKGIPSDQAEFGYPDVSIMLTCLSFYNTGLTLPQFQQSLGLLLKSEEPVREFESWTSEAVGFPESLRSCNSINIDDETQCAALWHHLRFQMAVINYFLNHFVFPRHAKTFDRKLVSSGWDIATPLRANRTFDDKNLKENMPPATRAKRAVGSVPTTLTVGFSGTNDNKTLLPLNIVQNDLPGLSHTNAEVLTYLLQPRNRRYIPACDPRGRRLSEKAFLLMLKDRGIRMLLDAGAQVLEHDNIALAKAWLVVDTEAEAAVFFGEDERARVVYRDGKAQPLAASPFLDNLGACVVYLDEAHTRGVDLKMPPQAIAALTLGVMQTKDHTVQAAMRLRQLAISQSVIFFAPPEVHQSILNTRMGSRNGPIDSHDVIIWLLEQTCCNIEQLQPLYVSQGLEYCRRRVAAQRYEDVEYNAGDARSYLRILEQPERYSLEELYAPDRKTKSSPMDSSSNAEITRYVRRLNDMKKDIRNTGDTVQALAHQEVEQEREVAIEVETVREVKKPHHATAYPQPPLHRDTRLFAETGRLAAGSHACIQAFVALRHTAVGRRLGISDRATQSGLYITQDFSKTVVSDHTALPRDEYSRPVHWVLWSTLTSTALIVTDYEADVLIPIIRDTLPPITHLISYAAPITKSMMIFDDLNFFSIPQLPHNWRAPAWLVRDLGIFAGRTYFDYDSQYPAVCEALGLSQPMTRTADLDREMPFSTGDDGPAEPFSPSPLLFIQDWLAIRRKGQDFSQTMMGEICQGRRLDKPEARQVDDEAEVEVVEEELLDNEGEDDA
ncbi:MAG: hypothetical protein Q9166_005318 [cf. Caloplaca sp. 2 TL-2023]